MNIDWTPSNNPPKPNVPILISFENLDYPLNGYYFDWNGKYVVRAQSEYDDDTYAYKFGKVNGWAYLPKCMKKETEVKSKMKIEKVTDTEIIFDNGKSITYYHSPDCCEDNYADFSILTPNTVNYDYEFPTNLQFKPVDGMGFKFGCDEHWIFIPCYSEQNGYYSDKIEILFDDVAVINNLRCESVYTP